MSDSRRSTKSALIIVIFTLGSKGLGFFREMLIASKFGSGMETDVFIVSMTATALVAEFLTNAISTTFIPVLSEIESKEGKDGKIKHSNNIINIIFVISIILIIGVWFAAPQITRLLAKGFDGQQYELAVKLTRLGTPMILFGGIIGVLTGYLQSEQRFVSTASIGFPFNFVYIFFLLFLSSKFGIKGLMISAVLAIGSQLLILLPDAQKAGYRYMLEFDIKDKYLARVIFLSVPVLIGVAMSDLNAIVDRTLASSLAVGSISALNYANKLIALILGVFIIPIITVLFPSLANEAHKNNITSMKRIMGTGINIILIITVPVTIGLIVLSIPIIEIIFQRGAFDIEATVRTAQALIYYSIGLVSLAIYLLLTKVYYSLQDTKTPMVMGAITVVINIALNLILVKIMGHRGLALATSIATTIVTIMLFYGLRKKIGSLGIRGYIIIFFKSFLASISMGAVVHAIYYSLHSIPKVNNLISVVIAVIIGVIVYLILCCFLKVDEVRITLKKYKDKLIK